MCVSSRNKDKIRFKLDKTTRFFLWELDLAPHLTKSVKYCVKKKKGEIGPFDKNGINFLFWGDTTTVSIWGL